MAFFDKLFANVDSRLLGTIFIVLFLYGLRWLLHRLAINKIRDLRSRYIWRQTANLAFFVLTLVLVVRLWAEWFHSVLTLLSVIAAAITIVSKELLLNFFSYGIIVWRGLFNVGDRIQIDNHRGDVMEIGPIYFSLSEIGDWVHGDEPTGRSLKIPNSMVLTRPVANYSRGLGLIWNEVSVKIDAASNWRKARDMAEKIVVTHSYALSPGELKELHNQNEEIMFVRQTPAVYLRIEGRKVELILRYICKFHKRRSSEMAIWEALLEAYTDEDDIRFSAAKQTAAEEA